jgi:hypothetical protein
MPDLVKHRIDRMLKHTSEVNKNGWC